MFLFCIKTLAVYQTGSLSILSSMVDSLSDIFASIITFLAIRISVRPASAYYRYGYGKAEALSALFQSFFVAISGFFIIYDAIIRFQKPHPLTQTTFGIYTMLFCLLITIALVYFQRFIAKKTSSQALKADSMHYIIDILTNSAIILSLFAFNMWQIEWLDTITAGAIAFYLLHIAYTSGKESCFLLLDKELPSDIRDHIFAIISQHPLAPNIHDLRTRNLGNTYMFEFHLELDGNLTLNTAHKYTQEIEDMLLKAYPDSQILIHQDPCGIKEERLDNSLSD